MKNRFFILFFFILSVACSNNGKKKSLDISEESIDAYVEEKLDTSQTFEILTGLRFSKNDETYEAVRFSQKDTVILYTEEITGATGNLYRNVFFKDLLPVYVEEYESILTGSTELYRQRKVYFNGAIILKAYEKTAVLEDDLENTPFKEITMTMNQFDFDRPENAVEQKNDYEMKFGEFLIFDLTSYLVLENEKSGYSVALYILEGDELIEELYANQEAYQRQTIHPYHDFMFVGGFDQMVYTGGYMVK